MCLGLNPSFHHPASLSFKLEYKELLGGALPLSGSASMDAGKLLKCSYNMPALLADVGSG